MIAINACIGFGENPLFEHMRSAWMDVTIQAMPSIWELDVRTLFATLTENHYRCESLSLFRSKPFRFDAFGLEMYPIRWRRAQHFLFQCVHISGSFHADTFCVIHKRNWNVWRRWPVHVKQKITLNCNKKKFPFKLFVCRFMWENILPRRDKKKMEIIVHVHGIFQLFHPLPVRQHNRNVHISTELSYLIRPYYFHCYYCGAIIRVVRGLGVAMSFIRSANTK